MNCQISEIIVYPIKSLGGVSLESAQVESRGLRYDRRWMLIDPFGKFVSQREFPALALAKVSFDKDGLIVTAPGKTPLHVPYHMQSSTPVSVRVWSDIIDARQLDSASDDWFSSYLGIPVSLVKMPDESLRPTKRKVRPDNILSFADGYPILLIGQSSLDELNSRLEEPVLMNRFRPNIVVAGSEPYAEDHWVEILVGTEHLHGVSNCSRCVMTTIEQETATRHVEPLKTLAEYRIVDQQIMFGRNLIPETNGWIHVGDEVESLRSKESQMDANLGER